METENNPSEVQQPVIKEEEEVKEKETPKEQHCDEQDEPLLMENPRRFVMFPIQHPDIWQFYKKAEGNKIHVHVMRYIERFV